MLTLLALAFLGFGGSSAERTLRASGVATMAYQIGSTIPWPAAFISRTLADGTPVAAFPPATVKAIVAALTAGKWVLGAPKGVAVLTIMPPDGRASLPAIDALRAASLAGQNIYLDADAAMKIGGSPAAPSVASTLVFAGLSLGNVVPPTGDPDTTQAVSPFPADAVAALNPMMPGMSYVLFAAAGETF